MRKIITAILIFIITIILYSCLQPNKEAFKPKVVYQTEDLIITQLSKHTFQHTSYFLSEDFGKVDCNGLIVHDKNEVVVFDTPADSSSSDELIKWVKNGLKSRIIALIPTHFHFDCVGGLKEFDRINIPSYANLKTIEFTKAKGFNVPTNGFKDSLILEVGNKKVIAKFFGEGHTRDNVIGYFPTENVMFGGCLIKEPGAGKGNLEDANVSEWSKTVRKIKNEYPNVSLIIPGHGKYGDKELLNYTINLFKLHK